MLLRFSAMESYRTIKKKRPRVPLSESCGCQMLFVHQASYPTETYDSLITLSALRGGENCLPLSSSFLKNLSLRTLRLFGSLWCQRDQSYKRGSGRNILFWLKRLAMCSNVFRALWLWLFFVINPAAINTQ